MVRTKHEWKGEEGEEGTKIWTGLDMWKRKTANKYWRLVNRTGGEVSS